MAETIAPKVSQEMLLDGARMMMSALIAGTMGFLKERGIPIKDWVTYLGEGFEGSWGDLEGRGADEVMEHFLSLDVLPMGVEVVSGQSSPERAEALVTSLPSAGVLEKFGTTPKDLLKDFGITQREFETIYRMHEPAARGIGFRFSHKVQDGHEQLVLEKAGRKQGR